jgi:hypothetical protein
MNCPYLQSKQDRNCESYLDPATPKFLLTSCKFLSHPVCSGTTEQVPIIMVNGSGTEVAAGAEKLEIATCEAPQQLSVFILQPMVSPIFTLAE